MDSETIRSGSRIVAVLAFLATIFMKIIHMILQFPRIRGCVTAVLSLSLVLLLQVLGSCGLQQVVFPGRFKTVVVKASVKWPIVLLHSLKGVSVADQLLCSRIFGSVVVL